VLESKTVFRQAGVGLPAGRGWIGPAAIVLAVLGMYLLLGSRTSLWDRDEPRFTRAAAEMLESGNYLVISFNDKPWPDKPILTYWLIALAIRVLGPTELACRLFGIVGTALTCGITFWVGRRLLDRRAALWAMVVLASTLQMLVIGAAATSDAILLPLTVTAMAVFAGARETGVRPVHGLLIGTTTGLAMLTKGPMGLMPALAILVVALLDRGDRRTRRASLLLVAAGVVIGTAVFCAWAIPSSVATEGEFLRVFIGRHVIGRALRPMEHHGGSFLLYLPYYIPVVIGGFFPWTLHLPGALVALAHGRIGGSPGRRFFLGWIVPPFVVMSLAATKLPHYIVFIWPALALTVGGVLVAAGQGLLTERDRHWLRGGAWFFGPLAAVLGAGLILGPWFLQVPGLRWSGAAGGAAILAMAGLAIRDHLADRAQRSAAILIVGMVLFQIPLQFGILPALERIKISPAIARAVNARTGHDVPVASYGYGEPTLNFYVGRHIEPLGSPEAVSTWAGLSGPRVLITPRDRLDEIGSGLGDLRMDEIGSARGINYSKGEPLEMVALLCSGEER
jgi:4-amino-4-deoxy-L-arabinose transferase-like glycosyltransferase